MIKSAFTANIRRRTADKAVRRVVRTRLITRRAVS